MQETLWAEIKNCHVLFGKYTLDSSTRYKTILKERSTYNSTVSYRTVAFRPSISQDLALS